MASILCTPLALATSPRPIDCEKAQSIKLGWTAKQVTRSLGKPYIIQFSRETMGYGWINDDGTDKIDVKFDLVNRKIDLRSVTEVKGVCSGKQIDIHLSPASIPANIEIPGVPRRIEFEGTSFYVGYVAESRGDSLVYVEYIPQGQSLIKWSNMIAIFHHFDGSTPEAKLELLRQTGERSGNPHFKQIYVSPAKNETAAAIPQMRDDSVEYQVAFWKTAPGGTLAKVYFSRSYKDDAGKVDRNVFIAKEEARIPEHLAALRGLPPITPPETGRSGTLTLTVDGTDNGEVLVPTTSTAN
ncbi:hypothetical protein [Xanthomonas vesicatoria]|uniref:hypothetical protein n=2 Tax=Xanthomonas vesicatoria TaxID=56460 RepID=UPI001E3167B9|nr:hypothetical protein [Xanthomonas vesicatoria]MCC8620105.1 hypothetical protein [Xanthomonas vesicatoria]MCC8633009.1 hypothetical protein [Xanthomonas vesicatoria]